MLIRYATLAITTYCLGSLALAAGPWEVEKTDIGVAVKKDGVVITNYVVKSGNKPILWPIVGPSGREMTRPYPMKDVPGEKADHVHHRSLWFTHGNVNGVSFWEEVNEKHAPGETVHREFVSTSGGDKATIVARTDWRTPQGERALEDERTITLHDDNNARMLDFSIVLKATDAPAIFGETKEGTFGLRVPTSMSVEAKQGGRIVNSEGDVDDAAWGKKASWVDYQGPIQGEKLGIAVLNHPLSFRYPTRWHVRTYGLFAANPWGTKDFTAGKESEGAFTLPKGESIKLRYRVIFHLGDEREAKIADAFAKYAKEN